ncbi:MAG: hypothetical protein LKJ03_04795 [Enterococcaceae bacterium]|nr:hypothetical protein [Enterococcaceae bacterium]MCI1919503.1 hypothetical protein [Enterococcaceae bacterium]
MKTRVAILFIGGLTLGAVFACGNTASAAPASGQTTITAATEAGEISMTIDPTIDFGTKPLAATIDFGSKDATLVVSDYTGSANGYTLQAKTEAADVNRTLQVKDITVSDTAPIEVLKKETDTFGINAAENLPVALKYTNVTEVKTFSFIVDWTLTKGWLQP